MLGSPITGFFEAQVESWQECVQKFDDIDFGRRDVIDYDLLCATLEVQTMRLRAWGNAVGLGDADISLADPRVNEQRTRVPVSQNLRSIHDIFKYPQMLEAHGLYPTDKPHGDGRNPQQSNKSSLFRRMYRNLRRSTRERQMTKKYRWAVYDGKKFQALVEKLKQCIDRLNGIFPGVDSKVAAFIRNDIYNIDEMGYLRLLQEATADEYADISEIVADRIGSLQGASTASRSVAPQISLTIETESSNPVHQLQAGNRENTNVHNDSVPLVSSDMRPEPQMDNLDDAVRSMDLCRDKKSDGALDFCVFGPAPKSTMVTAIVNWMGNEDRASGRFQDRDDGRDNDFVKLPHASFDLYHRTRFTKKLGFRPEEDSVLFDVESDPMYENVHAGTVTIEGFGLECWDYEEEFGVTREREMVITIKDVPGYSRYQLLRRLDELCSGGSQKFGRDADMDEVRLKEFVGDNRGVGGLYHLLNSKLFTNFACFSSICWHWNTDDANKNDFDLWNIFRQVIVTKELAMRLEHSTANTSRPNFTRKILASLIVCDLWLKNVRLVFADIEPYKLGARKAANADEEARAEHLKRAGDRYLQDGQYQDAFASYRNSLEIDSYCAASYVGAGTAMLALERFGEAHTHACTALIFDPNSSQAWALRGSIELKSGPGKLAEKSYLRAIASASSEATTAKGVSAPAIDSMNQQLEEARAKRRAKIDAIEKETDLEVQHALRMHLRDEDFVFAGKVIKLHSNVHEQQVEGLLSFAERMKWPYINEFRDYTENTYGEVQDGERIPNHVFDWLYGLVLPGEYMAFKIMAVVTLSTPSVIEALGTAASYYDCGLSLPECSYWRVRTVLGRVLGCLPSTTSLCGWVGPCPPVQFAHPLVIHSRGIRIEGNDKPRHVRLKADRVPPIETVSGKRVFYSGTLDPHGKTEPTLNEGMHHYATEMKEADNWVVPKPPARNLTAVKFDGIRLNSLPLFTQPARRIDAAVVAEVEYRASVSFKIGSSNTIDNDNDNDDDHNAQQTYTLNTEPVFVTLPPCLPGPSADGSHEVHIRDLHRYQRIISVDRLKDYKPNKSDDVVVINATSGGDAEVLARAWCAEKGRHAIIRRKGGPCYACAFRAATKPALEVGVLIWVS